MKLKVGDRVKVNNNPTWNRGFLEKALGECATITSLDPSHKCINIKFDKVIKWNSTWRNCPVETDETYVNEDGVDLIGKPIFILKQGKEIK